MNQNQITRKMQVQRDREIQAEMADRFDVQADKKFLAGDMDGARQLRETAVALRAASRSQVKRFLGSLWNSYAEADRAPIG